MVGFILSLYLCYDMQACQLKETLSTLDSNYAAREDKQRCILSVRKQVLYDFYVCLVSIGNFISPKFEMSRMNFS